MVCLKNNGKNNLSAIITQCRRLNFYTEMSLSRVTQAVMHHKYYRVARLNPNVVLLLGNSAEVTSSQLGTDEAPKPCQMCSLTLDTSETQADQSHLQKRR